MNKHKQPGDENLFVRFEKESFINEKRSLEDGKPVVIKQDFITILQRGSGKELIRRKVKEEDKLRFEEQWNGYLEGQKDDDIGSGTPLDMLPGVTKEQVVICKHLKLFTIEQVACMIDTDIKRLGANGRSLVEACKRFQTGKGHLETLIEEQAKQIKELQEALAEVSKPKRKRRKKTEEPVDELIDDSAEGSQTDTLV